VKFIRFKVSFSVNVAMTLVLCLSACLALVTPAAAGTCKDDDTYANACSGHPDCGSPTKKCVITLDYGSAVSVDPERVCVRHGTEVQWVEATSNYRLTVEFGTSPFADKEKSFKGTKSKPTTPEKIDANAADCYPYSVQQCDNSGCHSLDPKVIVNPGPP
jgi:hypothetical protein